MAAFTHLNPEGSRFSNGEYGVYYAAKSIETAVAETAFHRARFLAATKQRAIEIDMRSYASDIEADLHDIRGLGEQYPAIYDPDPTRYGAAQSIASELRAKGSNGIVYDSIRDPGGECVAIFRPKVLSPVRQGLHYRYVWDGSAIKSIYEIRSLPPS
jgi:RES domain-containing protein